MNHSVSPRDRPPWRRVAHPEGEPANDQPRPGPWSKLLRLSADTCEWQRERPHARRPPVRVTDAGSLLQTDLIPSRCCGTGREPRSRTGPDPLRADAVLAVHLLSGCGADHGQPTWRPRRGRDLPRDLRRCASVQLRSVASPERRAMFDINDFDETHPGPWDGTSSGSRRASRSPAVTQASPVRSDGRSWRRASPSTRPGCSRRPGMRNLDVWYAHIELDELFKQLKEETTKKQRTKARANLAQGEDPRQHEGVLQAHPRGRRSTQDRRRPSADRADRGRGGSILHRGRSRSRMSCAV